MTKTQLACAAALLMACATASAQVHQCKDATGKTIFSDRPCESGQSGGLVLRKRSQEEVLLERQAAAKAESRKQARERAELLEELQDRQRAFAAQPTAPQTTVSDWQRRKDAENAATSAGSITKNGGGWDREAAAARARQRRAQVEEPVPAAEPPPPNRSIRYCNDLICDDSDGNRYTRGNHGSYSSSDGLNCTVVAGSMRC